MPDLIDALERHGHLSLPLKVRKSLLTISKAAVDRILKTERHSSHKGISTTRTGGLLKRHIPVRTFTVWNEVMPGFFEVDLIAHCE